MSKAKINGTEDRKTTGKMKPKANFLKNQQNG